MTAHTKVVRLRKIVALAVVAWIVDLLAPMPGAAAPMTTATLWGSVRYTGPPVTRRPIEMRGDRWCIERQKVARLLQDDLIVGPNGGLRHAVVYVKDGPVARNLPAPQTPVELVMRDCVFVPRVVAVRAGQELRIRNEDRTLHTVYARASLNPKFIRPLHGPEDAPLTVRFNRPELPIVLRCDVQPWMIAFVGVFDHPYFAVTGEDGSYELPDLPEGDYTIEVWHERLGKLSEQIGLRAGERRALPFTYGPPK